MSSLHWVIASLVLGTARSLQPAVITVEAYPSRRVFGSLSQPLGSPWCDGMPTYWLVGHQGDDETPWCLEHSTLNANITDFSDYNYAGATFVRPRRAVLDSTDVLNDMDGPKNIDRHSCAAVDVDSDGTSDIVCGVGANRGTGHGFTELYLTGSDGNVTKVLDGHGLHKHTTIRSRWVEPLKGADGSQLLFVAARGAPRADNETNTHRMYRLVPEPAKKETSNSFYFREVQHYSWRRNTKASCLITKDFNNDGLDDVLICNEERRALMYLQNADSSWTMVPTHGNRSKDWRNARVADVTGDGIPDIVVVGRGSEGYVRIFKGREEFPHFNFIRKPHFELQLPFASPDVEIVDVNNDGILDLYVVQVNETVSSDNYCSYKSSTLEFFNKTGPRAPDGYTPPSDRAADLVLIGMDDGSSFESQWMDHAEPGCGYMVQQFGSNRTLLLAQGSQGRSGHNLLLQW